jgi:DNA helicase-2/ATP-dependent DNA helicase PcrA
MAALDAEYRRRRRAANVVDFYDMVDLGMQLIEEHEWVRAALRAQFPVIVIDEYQDLGVPLHRIVTALQKLAHIRIVAVGDPDQSIYGFNGAAPHLLEELAKDPDFEAIHLRLNYRCGRRIVEHSMTALGHKRDYESASSEAGDVMLWKCPQGIEQQLDLAYKELIPAALAKKQGRTLQDIAILYLDKHDASAATEKAKEHGFKYVGGDRETRYPALPITMWLEECAAWCSGGWMNGKPPLSEILAFWRLACDGLAPDTQVALRRRLVAFLRDHRTPDQPLHKWLEMFHKTCLADVVPGNQRFPESNDALELLRTAAGEDAKVGTYTVAEFAGLRGAPDHVNLVTLHSSKGLEFDVVIMIGLEDGRLPRYDRQTGNSLREERRLFYVGLTRARHEVYLLYSGWYFNKYRKRFNNGRSRFVDEIA